MDFRNEYRVVRWRGPATCRLWYVPQVRRWWFPVWLGNAFSTDFFAEREEALAWCAKHADRERPISDPPEYLGRLP